MEDLDVVHGDRKLAHLELVLTNKPLRTRYVGYVSWVFVACDGACCMDGQSAQRSLLQDRLEVLDQEGRKRVAQLRGERFQRGNGGGAFHNDSVQLCEVGTVEHLKRHLSLVQVDCGAINTRRCRY